MAFKLFIASGIMGVAMLISPAIGAATVRTIELFPTARRIIWWIVCILLLVNTKFLYTNRGVLRDNTQVGDAKRLNALVETMYENNPGQLDTKLDKYKDMFTAKGFVSIDSKDNVVNIINRYSRYSKEGNKVKIEDTLFADNKVYVRFKIYNADGESVTRLGEFTKGVGGYTNYLEYTLWEEDWTSLGKLITDDTITA